jgi:hypothetical protein
MEWILTKLRQFFIRLVPSIQNVAWHASHGRLSDPLIDTMLETKFKVGYCREEVIYKAAIELAKHGTPQSCYLAIQLSNYSDIKYPEEIEELLRDAACKFAPSDGHKRFDISRIIDIVRGKYLYIN